MLNLCIFIFIIYAMSYSVKAILFGGRDKKRRKQSNAARSQCRGNYSAQAVKSGRLSAVSCNAGRNAHKEQSLPQRDMRQIKAYKTDKRTGKKPVRCFI